MNQEDRSSTQDISVSGFRYINLEKGSYTYNLRFKNSKNDGESYISNSRMEIWRIEKCEDNDCM